MKKLFILTVLCPFLMVSQHKIEGNFQPVTDYTYAFLYHSTPTGSNYIDRAELDEKGDFSISFDSTTGPGIYKIVYALPPEENNFDFIYNGKEDISFTYSDDKGLEFTASNENKLWSSYTKSMELVNMTISNFYTQESTDKKAFKDIFKTLKDTQTAFEDASKGTMANVFIVANRPYVPTEYEDISTYSANLKASYLKHVDFKSVLLQSSDFLTDRVLAYVFGMSASTSNETHLKDIDTLMSYMNGVDTTVKVSLLELIWHRFSTLQNDDVANAITDKYLFGLAKATHNDQLAEYISVYKNNSIGKKAHNFDIAISKNGTTTTTSLHDLNSAEHYIVVFWSSTCGHCLEELPKLKQLMASKPDYKVIAVGLEDENTNWQKQIANYPDFIHVLGLGKWDNPISNAYSVGSTPSYFVLDKNKTITAKPYDVEALTTLLK